MLFAVDVETVDLTSFDSAVIASTMKKYLRELPNPVIPEQFYTKFIDAASELKSFWIFFVKFVINVNHVSYHNCLFTVLVKHWKRCVTLCIVFFWFPAESKAIFIQMSVIHQLFRYPSF